MLLLRVVWSTRLPYSAKFPRHIIFCDLVILNICRNKFRRPSARMLLCPTHLLFATPLDRTIAVQNYLNFALKKTKCKVLHCIWRLIIFVVF